jgi:hypothetical protein
MHSKRAPSTGITDLQRKAVSWAHRSSSHECTRTVAGGGRFN